MTEDELAKKVIGTSIAVHRALGPGLLEKVYAECLAHKLTKEGLLFEKEKPIKVEFEGATIDCGFR